MSLKIGTTYPTGEPVYITGAERIRGLYMLGKNHTGKSNLLEQVILHDIEAGMGTFVLDPHGDLVKRVMCRMPASRSEDVIFFDLKDTEKPLGLNIFECPHPEDEHEVRRITEQVVQAFYKIWSIGPTVAWGVQIEDTLRNAAHVLVKNNLTLVQMGDLLSPDDSKRLTWLKQVHDTEVLRFWHDRFPSAKNEHGHITEYGKRLQREYSGPVMNKVVPLLSAARHIVEHQQSSIHWDEDIARGRIILVRLDSNEELATNLLGSILTGQFLTAALRRTRGSQPFSVFADEYHRFDTPAFATLIDEARKKWIATTMTHQHRTQLLPERRGNPLSAVGLIVFEVTGQDAKDLAREFNPPRRVKRERGQPIRVLSSDPLRELLTVGHTDPETNQFLSAVRIDFARRQETIDQQRAAYPGMSLNDFTLQDAAPYINTLITTIERDPAFATETETGREVSDRFIRLRRENPSFESTLQELFSRFEHIWPLPFFEYRTPHQTSRDFPRQWVKGKTEEDMERWFHKQLSYHLMNLIACCGYEKNRIYTESGQYETVEIEEEQNQAWDRLAGQMVSFERDLGGKGYCYYKLSSGEGLMRTHPNPGLTAAQVAQATRIREWSRTTYGRVPPEPEPYQPKPVERIRPAAPTFSDDDPWRLGVAPPPRRGRPTVRREVPLPGKPWADEAFAEETAGTRGKGRGTRKKRST